MYLKLEDAGFLLYVTRAIINGTKIITEKIIR